MLSAFDNRYLSAYTSQFIANKTVVQLRPKSTTGIVFLLEYIRFFCRRVWSITPPTKKIRFVFLQWAGYCVALCLSVRPSRYRCHWLRLFGPASVTSRHLANYNDTHVLFGTHWGSHIVRPSRPHKFLLLIVQCPCNSLTVTASLKSCSFIHSFIHSTRLSQLRFDFDSTAVRLLIKGH